MAALKSVPDGIIQFLQKGNRMSRHPLGKWLDGKRYLLVQGEDFSERVSVPCLKAYIRRSAKRRGLLVQIRNDAPVGGWRAAFYVQVIGPINQKAPQ